MHCVGIVDLWSSEHCMISGSCIWDQGVGASGEHTLLCLIWSSRHITSNGTFHITNARSCTLSELIKLKIKSSNHLCMPKYHYVHHPKLQTLCATLSSTPLALNHGFLYNSHCASADHSFHPFFSPGSLTSCHSFCVTFLHSSTGIHPI